MRSVIFSLLLALTACAQPEVRTVTVHVTTPVYPPQSLYADSGPCVHGVRPLGDTVGDMVDALITERLAVDACRADRAALRQWRLSNGK